MKPEIEALIRNTVRLDETVPAGAVEIAILALKGERLVREEDAAGAKLLPPLCHRPELAAMFRVNVKTISNWARQGRLDCVKDRRGQTLGYTPESALAIRRGER